MHHLQWDNSEQGDDDEYPSYPRLLQINMIFKQSKVFLKNCLLYTGDFMKKVPQLPVYTRDRKKVSIERV